MEIVEEMEADLEDSVEYTFSLLNTKDNRLEIIQVVCLEIMEYIRKSKIIDDDRKFNKHPEKYSRLLDEDKVFIRGDEMADIVSMKLRRGVSKKEISAALYQYGLVTKRNGRYSRKIPHSESNQKLIICYTRGIIQRSTFGYVIRAMGGLIRLCCNAFFVI